MPITKVLPLCLVLAVGCEQLSPDEEQRIERDDALAGALERADIPDAVVDELLAELDSATHDDRPGADGPPAGSVDLTDQSPAPMASASCNVTSLQPTECVPLSDPSTEHCHTLATGVGPGCEQACDDWFPSEQADINYTGGNGVTYCLYGWRQPAD